MVVVKKKKIFVSSCVVLFRVFKNEDMSHHMSMLASV